MKDMEESIAHNRSFDAMGAVQKDIDFKYSNQHKL